MRIQLSFQFETILARQRDTFARETTRLRSVHGQKLPWLVTRLPSNLVRLAHSRSRREGRERMLCQSDLRVQHI